MDGYEERVIAFLDILGFKEIVKNNELEEIRTLFRYIFDNDDARSIFHMPDDVGEEYFSSYNEVLDKIEIRVISDSIIISVPNTSNVSLAVVVDVCYFLQKQLYEFDRPVFLRGAIDIGEIYFDDKLVFGKGLITAYLAQENYAIFPRIILTERVLQDQRLSIEEGCKKVFTDSDGYYYIDTIRRFIPASTPEELTSHPNYQLLVKAIEDSLFDYNDPRIRQKYLWLKDKLDSYKDHLNYKGKGIITVNI